MTLPVADRRLYDARRQVYYDKPMLRGWSHLVVFVAAVVMGILVILDVRGSVRTSVAAIYVSSVAGLFGASALYHRGRWGQRAAERLQRLDHTMIIVLIAGSATPPVALSLPGSLRVAGVATLWALAGAAILVRWFWMQAPEKVVGSIYLTLGWVAGAAIPAVWLTNGVAPATLLISGGLLYTLGALGYHYRVPQLRPSVFGYHEVFHVLVIAAAACQYVAIAGFIL